MIKSAFHELFVRYQQALQHDPVYYDRGMDAWKVFRYKDVTRVLLDQDTFSSQFTFSGVPLPLDVSMISLDLPRHARLRKLIAPFFAPSAIEALQPRISAIVDALLDRIIEHGEPMDVIDDLASPLPIMVMSGLLGVPDSDYERVRHWTEQLACAVEPDGSNPQAEMSVYFTDLLEQRRLQDPEPSSADLVSTLLAALKGEDALSMLDLLGFCILFLVAGTITTTHLIGNTLLCLTRYQASMEGVYGNRGLVAPCIEEVLRYCSPVQSMFRIATRDTNIGECTIKKGQFIVAYIGAANRDPEVFMAPDTFDIWRQENRHIAFGYGIHHCVGATLARLEARIALDRMLMRLPALHLVRTCTLQPLNPHTFLYGVRHLPLNFHPPQWQRAIYPHYRFNEKNQRKS